MFNPIELCFASSNLGKLKEVRNILDPEISVKGLSELGWEGVLPETGHSFEENAMQKIQAFHQQTGLDGFAEDSGLVITALDGRPGIFTARYAGPNASSDDNMSLVLEQMKDIEDRSAKFVAVIALLYKGQTRLFKGEVGGTIALERSGVRGFGYDPIFIPQGYERSFADLPSEVKNEISHRRKALVQLKEFLNYG